MSDYLERMELVLLLKESNGQITDDAEKRQINITNNVPTDLHVLGYPDYLADIFARLLEEEIKVGRKGLESHPSNKSSCSRFATH